MNIIHMHGRALIECKLLAALYLLPTWSSLGEDSKGEELWVLRRYKQQINSMCTLTSKNRSNKYSVVKCKL